MEEPRASERRVCERMAMPKTAYRYQSCRDDSELRERLLALARERPGSATVDCTYCCAEKRSRGTIRRCSGWIASFG